MAEKLIVLKENLVEDFKENSLHKAVAGEGLEKDEEGLELYLEDLEEELEDGEEGAEEDAEEL